MSLAFPDPPAGKRTVADQRLPIEEIEPKTIDQVVQEMSIVIDNILIDKVTLSMQLSSALEFLMGRRAGISSTEQAFRQAFANALRGVIGKDRGAASRAAEELRISRQAVSLYLKEKVTPSAEVIRRVCKLWGLSLDIQGNIVSEGSFRQQPPGPIPAPPLQLPLLPDALESLTNENVKVKIARKVGDSIDLEVKIDFRQ